MAKHVANVNCNRGNILQVKRSLTIENVAMVEFDAEHCDPVQIDHNDAHTFAQQNCLQVGMLNITIFTKLKLGFISRKASATGSCTAALPI